MTVKLIFAAVISATLVAAVPLDQAQAQAPVQQETKAERAKQKAAATEARKKARQERIKAAEDRSTAHKQAIEAQHQKMRTCAAKWLEQKKSAADKSRRAYNAFMTICRSQ